MPTPASALRSCRHLYVDNDEVPWVIAGGQKTGNPAQSLIDAMWTIASSLSTSLRVGRVPALSNAADLHSWIRVQGYPVRVNSHDLPLVECVGYSRRSPTLCSSVYKRNHLPYRRVPIYPALPIFHRVRPTLLLWLVVHGRCPILIAAMGGLAEWEFAIAT